MPVVHGVRWALAERPDGHSWEVVGDGGVGAERVYGVITLRQDGYSVQDEAARIYGPFPTLDEAAYPLAVRESGRDPGGLLLGEPRPAPVVPPPVPGGSAVEQPAGTPALPAPPVSGSAGVVARLRGRRWSPPPANLVVWTVVGLVLVLAPRMAAARRRRASLVERVARKVR
ncbi:hypothetical protein QDR37_05955 [Amnibacterium sp. CER49]|uniref:hypothetical protein n=1 Tax=Amnibacterium sp. CER49 TaxID=3039161 RepID=UPI00244811DE|nr:hypothetical protein [Amnibacterium sp. CER49]MDH2443484.1 hypothetical protein [Amnibacterium sp. CER49]